MGEEREIEFWEEWKMKISIVDFSEIKANKIWRLEAEFYSQKSLVGSGFVSGEDAIDFVQYGTSEELNEFGNGFPVLRLNEFDGLFIKNPEKSCDKISRSIYENLSLKKDDILICRTNGNPKLVGKSALVPKDYNFAFASYLFRIRPKKEIINPASLVIYLNSRIGRSQIEKNLMVSNQANFSPAKFREIQVPILSAGIQDLIEKIVYRAYEKQESSNLDYREAEKLLLSELGLLNWKPKRHLSFVKNFSDAKSADRIDAEYFQPMYEEILNRSKNKIKTVKVDEVFTFRRGDFIDTKYYTGQKTKRAYLRIKELSNVGSITSNEVIYIEDAFNDTSQNTLKEYDIVMAIIGDTIGKSNLIFKEFVGSYFSNNTGRFRLRPETRDSYDPFYLETLFHSVYIQSQVDRAKAQTGQPKIADKEIRKIFIPCISLNKQKQIGDNIKKAIENKNKSKCLLDIAKRGVEMAIEKNEKDAERWINNELNKVGVGFKPTPTGY